MHHQIHLYCCALLLSLAPAAFGQAEHVDETAIRFRATVIEVHLPNAASVQLDADTLAQQADTPAALLEALGRFGRTKVLHRFDQYLPGDEPSVISTHSHAAIIVSITNPNAATTTVNYRERDFGTEAQIEWHRTESDDASAVQLSMQWKITALRAIPIPVDHPEPTTFDVHTSILNFAGVTATDKPIILLTIVNDPREEDGAIAYVVRAAVSERAKP